jgi:DNA-binding response OmpR family regulator
VLLVEPHGDTRELYHLWLTQCGFAVTAATSGPNALAEACLIAPDVIVVEPMIAHDGVALVRALRREAACADAVLIVITTQACAAQQAAAVEAGADACLLKPCSMAHLAQAIADASRRRVWLVSPEPRRTASSRARVRQAARRCRAIRERLSFEPTVDPPLSARLRPRR